MAYQYDPRTGQYVNDGVAVPVEQVRAALARIVDDSADRLQVLAERYRDGRLDLLGWRVAVRHELKVSYGVAATLAQGGLARMTPTERGVLSGLLREQYSFADNFALDLAQGRVDPASDAFLARARLYAGGAWHGYERFSRDGARGRGATHERNVLGGAAAHCDECAGLAARKWVPVGTLPLPGTRQCVTNCKCSIQYEVRERTGVA